MLKTTVRSALTPKNRLPTVPPPEGHGVGQPTAPLDTGASTEANTGGESNAGTRSHAPSNRSRKRFRFSAPLGPGPFRGPLYRAAAGPSMAPAALARQRCSQGAPRLARPASCRPVMLRRGCGTIHGPRSAEALRHAASRRLAPRAIRVAPPRRTSAQKRPTIPQRPHAIGRPEGGRRPEGRKARRGQGWPGGRYQWRRRESNPRPVMFRYERLRVYPVYLNLVHASPADRVRRRPARNVFDPDRTRR
jgi:hypothetical protein